MPKYDSIEIITTIKTMIFWNQLHTICDQIILEALLYVVTIQRHTIVTCYFWTISCLTLVLQISIISECQLGNPQLWYTATLCLKLGSLLVNRHKVAVYHSSTDFLEI